MMCISYDEGMEGMRHSTLHQRTSHFFQWVDEVTSRVGAAAGVAALLLVFMIGLAFAGYPSTWQMYFATASNAIVLVMLFVLKHTQDRQQTALQLKLDELIRASPVADDHLVQIERADEHELIEREKAKIEVHEALRSDVEEPSNTLDETAK
jgi:low affinity Fe/Cu permease